MDAACNDAIAGGECGAKGAAMNGTGVHEEYEPCSMTIEWFDADEAFIVTVPELPGCRTHGATRADAVKQGEDAIATWIDGARADGEMVPPPRVFVAGGH
jgi:predicted RNase H-like HicB family nuclease